MFRLVLRYGLLLTVLVGLSIFVVRAQPYDDSELRALLMPVDDCDAACFMGIQPGVTTTREALGILQTHDWVDDVTLGTSFGINNSLETVSGQVEWTWSGHQPALIIPNQSGQVSVGNGLVHSISIPLQFTLGDVMLLLGSPDSSRLASHSASPPEIVGVRAAYGRERLAFSMTWYCVYDTVWKPRHTKLPVKPTVIFTDDSATASNIQYDVSSILFPCV